MFDKIRAELFEMAQTAILPCGCTGVVIGHDDDSVHFGIERLGCDLHDEGAVVDVDKNALLTPSQIGWPFGG